MLAVTVYSAKQKGSIIWPGTISTPHNLINFMCPFLLTDVTVVPVYVTIYTEDCLYCTSLAAITFVFISFTQHHICKFKSCVPIGVFDLWQIRILQASNPSFMCNTFGMIVVGRPIPSCKFRQARDSFGRRWHISLMRSAFSSDVWGCPGDLLLSTTPLSLNWLHQRRIAFRKGESIPMQGKNCATVLSCKSIAHAHGICGKTCARAC